MTAVPQLASPTRPPRLVENPWFQGLVFALIIANALILGAETFDAINAATGTWLGVADRLIIYTFLAEIGLRIAAYWVDFFKNGWDLFDFVVILISLLAATSGLGALRAFRVLRILRVITIIPRMRVVVSALLDAIRDRLRRRGAGFNHLCFCSDRRQPLWRRTPGAIW